MPQIKSPSPHRNVRRRGMFLIAAMMLVVILAFVATMMLQLNFGRHITILRGNESESDKDLAFGVQSQLLACLEGTEFGRTDCNLPSSTDCPPTSIAGKTVSVSASGSPPNCQLTIKIGN